MSKISKREKANALFFIKNTLNKNSEAQIPRKIRTN